MSYTPNFNDPRVQERTVKALKFCARYLRSDRDQWVSKTQFDKVEHFGSSRNELSKWLKKKLLIEVSGYNMWAGKCKSYRLYQQAFDELQLMTNTHIIEYSVVDLKSDFQTELETGEFEYNDKSSRLYHPIQNCPRATKRQLLNEQGYAHNYDIVCAMPTLIHQYAQQIPEVVVDGKWKQGPMDLYLFGLRDYLKNRQTIREQLARDTEVEPEVIKRLINGLFNGGQISHNKQGKSYAELDGDHARIEFLQQNEFIKSIKEDIKTCWEYIVPTMPPRYSKPDKNGVVKRAPFSSKRKSALYRDLERKVLDSVRDYLDQRDIKYFCEHDGWATDCELNVFELKTHIKEQTGYSIEIEKSDD